MRGAAIVDIGVQLSMMVLMIHRHKKYSLITYNMLSRLEFAIKSTSVKGFLSLLKYYWNI
jgi:hypothetical protein